MGALATIAPTALGSLYSSSPSDVGRLTWYNLVPVSNDLGGLLIWAVCLAYIACAACFGMAATTPGPSLDNAVPAQKKVT
jgi:hypothetical protein